MYRVAKEMVNIHLPLVGSSPHHIRNTHHFVEQAKSISYDVKVLFTLVLEEPSQNIICSKLQQDSTLHSRTPLSTYNIVSLLDVCLKSTFFTFQGKHYEQEADMGYPQRPMVVKLFMEDFKARALSSPPQIWLRFVDDTFIVHMAEHTQQFLPHLNSLDPHIQFTTEFPDHSSLLGHLSFTNPQMNTNQHSVQKAYTYR